MSDPSVSRVASWLRLQWRRVNWIAFEIGPVISGSTVRNPYGTPSKGLGRDDGWPR